MSQSHKQQPEHSQHIFTPGQQQHTDSKDASQTAGHEGSEHIKQLAHHIVSNTPETDLPAVRHLLTQHPVSKNVLHEWYKKYKPEAFIPEEDDEETSTQVE